jgi:hypothetical protein
MAGYTMAKVVPTPPGIGHEALESVARERPPGFLLMLEETGFETLLKSAARDGVPGLSLVRLKALLRMLPIDYGARRKPTSVYECARWVISHALGVAYTDEPTLGPILAKRGCKPPPRFAASLTAEDVVHTEGVLNSEDVSDIRKSAAEQQSRQNKGAGKSDSKSSSSKAVSKSSSSGLASGPARPRLLALNGGEEVDLIWARQFLPPGVRGCTLSKDNSFHYRFIGSYPNAEPPRSSAKSWNAKITQWASCVYCLQWVWACHTRKEDVPCPYDFLSWVQEPDAPEVGAAAAEAP